MNNRSILLLNSIVELTGGIVLVLYPEFLTGGERMDNLELNLAKMYGIAAGFIGLISYVLFRFCESELLIKYSCLSIIVFHLLLSFHLYGMYQVNLLAELYAVITHVIITITFGIIYLKNIK